MHPFEALQCSFYGVSIHGKVHTDTGLYKHGKPEHNPWLEWNWNTWYLLWNTSRQACSNSGLSLKLYILLDIR